MRKAIIVAARRSALGRVGGLHRARRFEALAAPVIEAALKDAGLDASRVDQLILGSSIESANPARLVALAAGLADRCLALTVDRQCASALDAVLIGERLIAAGEADVVVAGGVEAVSMAPWRVARPRNGAGLPRFLSPVAEPVSAGTVAEYIEAAEILARTYGITRQDQDAYVLRSHGLAELAQSRRRFVGEIVPIKAQVEEAHDQTRADQDGDDLAGQAPFRSIGGTVTAGNIASPADGAGFVVLMAEGVRRIGALPAGMRIVARASCAVAPGETASAALVALEALRGRATLAQWTAIGAVELAEATAVEALAVTRALGFKEDIVSRDGSAVSRGRPGAACGGGLLARLFTHLVRVVPGDRVSHGAACVATTDGMATALLAERVG